jgi:hypothetical protein
MMKPFEPQRQEGHGETQRTFRCAFAFPFAPLRETFFAVKDKPKKKSRLLNPAFCAWTPALGDKGGHLPYLCAT